MTWSSDGSDTTVRADTDSNTANGAEIMFVLTGVHNLTVEDFIL